MIKHMRFFLLNFKALEEKWEREKKFRYGFGPGPP